MRHICQIITSEQLDDGLIPASVLTQAAINSFLGSDEGFCYFSDTSLIIPSEGQKLLLHSMHLRSEEVSLEEHCSPAPTNYRNYHTKEQWDFQTEERIHSPLNQQQCVSDPCLGKRVTAWEWWYGKSWAERVTIYDAMASGEEKDSYFFPVCNCFM